MAPHHNNRHTSLKAVVYEQFASTPSVTIVEDPAPQPHGVVIRVEATGLCRSDWHGWMGHDPDIRLPHVPGHELAGVIAAVGRNVRSWRVGQRVTVPFVVGCGTCEPCHAGQQQVCDRQFQPGFTHWGSFAEYVAIDRADLNLVLLPEHVDFRTAASLGCRFATAFRALIDQSQIRAGQSLAVHGCGGVGLSAIMIARAAGARIIAVDIDDAKLKLALELGADATLNSTKVLDVPQAIMDFSSGGVHVSMDALGHPDTCANSINALRTQGKHVQVGLMMANQATPAIPMGRVIARELQLLGSHGMQAHRYPAMLQLIQSGRMDPSRLVGQTISLEQAPQALMNMNHFRSIGATIVTEF